MTISAGKTRRGNGWRVERSGHNIRFVEVLRDRTRVYVLLTGEHWEDHEDPDDHIWGALRRTVDGAEFDPFGMLGGSSGFRHEALMEFDIPVSESAGSWEFEVREAGRVVLTATGELP